MKNLFIFKKRIFAILFFIFFIIFFIIQFGVDFNGYSERGNKTPVEYFLASEVGENAEFAKTVIEQKQKFPDTLFIAGDSKKDKKISLTFDDGPSPTYTPVVLDILDKYNVSATFFLPGTQVERYPEIVKEIKNRGHLIANHSYSHQDFRKLTWQEVKKEIEKTNKLIKEYSDQESILIRPPYGAILDEQLKLLAEKQYKIINWSLDLKDWNQEFHSKEIIRERINNYLHNCGILLLHDGGGDRSFTVDILPDIIEFALGEGYKFITVEKMIN